MSATTLCLLNARLAGSQTTRTLWIRNGRFVQQEESDSNNNDDDGDDANSTNTTWTTLDLGGKLVWPGLIETHLHLDKAGILPYCCLVQGTLDEAIQQTSAAKAKHFNVDEIYDRAARVVQKAVKQGTTHIRTHVEVDPVIGLVGLQALERIRHDYAWALTMEICVFPQEGMLNRPGTQQLLEQALAQGRADVLGGCPYTDSSPHEQIARLFAMAVHYNVDLDFHLDFNLNPDKMDLSQVCRQTMRHQWQGRVTVGHVTALSMLAPDAWHAAAQTCANSGVAVTVLPSTDLFLAGRGEYTHAKPRGVTPLWELHQKYGITCSLATNNVSNPFTPYGDASLVRQANLYANITQLATKDELTQCLRWVSTDAARLLRLDHYGLEPGCWADFCVFNVPSPDAVIAEIASPVMSFKRGRQVMERPETKLLWPLSSSS